VMAPTKLVSWVASQLGDDACFIGDALAAYPELGPLPWQAATPSGSSVALLALTGPQIDVLTSGGPTYVRASEAEIKYPDGVPGALRTKG